MNKKVSPAVWFVPLLAVVLAFLFTVLVCGGMYFYKHLFVKAPAVSEPQPQKPVDVVSLANPAVEVEEDLPPGVEIAQPPTAETEEDTPSAQDICEPVATVPLRMRKPRRRAAVTLNNGIAYCQREGLFPCAWEKSSKHYWMLSAQGPIRRGVYNKRGNLISETTATLSGQVLSHTVNNITWFFDEGKLVKIRTSPYENCNFHDWFFINEAGVQDVCQCVYAQKNCCARSPYRTGQATTYCELFAGDTDFCVK